MIIYLIGCILSLAASIQVILIEEEKLTVKDLVVCLGLSILSWLLFIIIVVGLWGDVVIYSKHQKV